MIKKMFFGMLALGFIATSCSSDDDNTPRTANLTLNLNGLENLGPDFLYEGWVIVNGSPVSTGTFSVDDSGNLSATSFTINKADLDAATTFVLSIEEVPDPSPAPSDTKILAGDFSGNSASVTTGIVGDFSSASGVYILATPTDGGNTHEDSGVWFLDNSSGSAAVGLSLPALDAGWKYEGWAVIDGTPVSTGTFTDPDAADDNAATSPFKGAMGNGPDYPGEDFLQNAPGTLTFPTSLKGGTIVISVEPSPDNSSAPFTLKPLVHGTPADATDHTALTMNQNLSSLPSGTVSR